MWTVVQGSAGSHKDLAVKSNQDLKLQFSPFQHQEYEKQNCISIFSCSHSWHNQLCCELHVSKIIIIIKLKKKREREKRNSTTNTKTSKSNQPIPVDTGPDFIASRYNQTILTSKTQILNISKPSISQFSVTILPKFTKHFARFPVEKKTKAFYTGIIHARNNKEIYSLIFC